MTVTSPDDDIILVVEEEEPDLVLIATGTPGPQGNVGPQGTAGNQGTPGSGVTNGQPRYSFPYPPPDTVIGANPHDQWLNTATGDIYTLV